MNKFEIVSKYKDKDIHLPKRSTGFSAGYDFEVAEDIVIPPLEHLTDELRAHWNGTITLNGMAQYTKRIGAKPTLVPTGIKAKITPGWYLKLVVRSSLPLKHWLILANSEGVIDGDYYNNPDNEGEIFFQLINLSPFPILLKKGDKIGQGIFIPYGITEEDHYGEGETRKGGFGSTSKQSTTESVNAPYIIGNVEATIPIEPKYITTTNVEEDKYYQITFDDISKTP